MTNEHLIRSAHVWALAIFLAFGVMAFAVSGESGQTQNSNSSQTQNSNRNRNSNSNSSSSSNATGERTAAAAVNADDRKFMMEAATGGMMEVELGRLAAQQGSSDAVKKFGQRMIDDHSKANEELMQLASTKGVTLPTELDAKHKNEVTKLSKMTGADFDRAYSKMMLSDHVKDVAEFEKQSTKANDADLRAFTAKTLPTLQEHLQLAKAMNATTGGPKNSNPNRP